MGIPNSLDPRPKPLIIFPTAKWGKLVIFVIIMIQYLTKWLFLHCFYSKLCSISKTAQSIYVMWPGVARKFKNFAQFYQNSFIFIFVHFLFNFYLNSFILDALFFLLVSITFFTNWMGLVLASFCSYVLRKFSPLIGNFMLIPFGIKGTESILPSSFFLYFSWFFKVSRLFLNPPSLSLKNVFFMKHLMK